ncbi:MAG: DUF11 domain-containing protein [Crocinitomicaceae bacterium]|nr:MAG: DUF11 domain-containing protein [Crocinitomicaceae bacterium]
MKIINKIRGFSTKTKASMVVALLAVGVIVPIAVNAEFYPARAVYDYNKYDGNDDCNDPNNIATQNGRCGSMNGPVFNSFINTPSYGDERAFFDGRRSDMPASTNADQINDVTNGSKEVVLRTYVHNNANQTTNASGKGVATGANVRIALPTATEQVLRARSYISANNATTVEDTADMLGSRKFSVSYVPGSAKLLRGTASYGLSDSIVTTGAPIGYNSMDGNLPGCFEYAALVEIRVKVNVQTAPDLQLTKEVRKNTSTGTTDWGEETSVKPGEKVQWLLGTKNIGDVTLDQVKARDVLPPHLTVVPGSVKVYNGNDESTQNDVPLFGGGLILGTYPVGGIKYITFETIAKDDFEGCSVRLRNLAYANSQQTPTEDTNDAVVNITKDDCNPPEEQKPNFKIEKGVRISGSNSSFTQDVKLKYGDKAEYQVLVTNTGETELKNVVIKDTLPAGVTYENGSLKVNGESSDGDLFGSGVVIPSIAKGAEVKITFTAKVNRGEGVSCDLKTYRNVASADPEGSGEGLDPKEDDANVKADCDEAPVTPKYSCDLLDLKKTGGRNISVKVNASASGGAVIKQYMYDFGDGNTLTTDKNAVDHSFAQDGRYVVRAKVLVSVNDQTITVESDACAKAVEFVKGQPKCEIPGKEHLPADSPECATTPVGPTPTTPGKLPETGAGSIAVIFLVVTGVASAGYYALAYSRR